MANNAVNDSDDKIKELVHQNQILTKRLTEHEIENAVFQCLSTNLDLDETVEAIRILFQTRFSFDQFAVLLTNSKVDHLTVTTSYGLIKNTEGLGFDLKNGLFGEVSRKKEFTYIPDIGQESRYNPKYFFDNTTGSFLCIPLFNDRQKAFGVIGFYRSKNYAFTDAEINYLFRITHRVASVLYKAILFKHTKALSITDPLTGLFNRRYFDERYEREVQRARRYKRALSVLMIDIDYFKIYNDTHGHLMGDEVLKRVAQLLEANLRRVDFLARFGGEEFVILLPEIDFENGLIVAEKLRRTIEQNYFIGEEDLPNGRLTISLGLSSYHGNGLSSEALLDLADKGLYQAKSKNRNCVGFI